MSSLQIIKPIQVSDAMLISSTVPETDYAAWSSGTTYAIGDRVILTSTHKIYESLQASNLNKPPATSPAHWIVVSPTNRWKAFDAANSTATTQASSISYVLRAGTAVKNVAVLGLVNASSLRLVLTDPVYGVVFDKTINFSTAPLASDWWSWFFGQRSGTGQHIELNLPAYPAADLTVTLTGGSTLAVGVILLGQLFEFSLGVEYGARIGIQDYSRKQTNDFGDVELVRRAYARRASFGMTLVRAEVDAFQNFLTEVRTTPCVWIGTYMYESTTLYGFYKSFDIVIQYPGHANCSLDIEGLT